LKGGGGSIGLSTNVSTSIVSNGTSHNRTTSKTAPARLEGFDDDEEEDNALFKVDKNDRKLKCLKFEFDQFKIVKFSMSNLLYKLGMSKHLTYCSINEKLFLSTNYILLIIT
jgi:hypothetical protein